MLLSRKLLVLSTYPSRQLFTSGSGSVALPQGRYTIVIRGGGGAGGGFDNNTATGGYGGRGGNGQIIQQQFVIRES